MSKRFSNKIVVIAFGCVTALAVPAVAQAVLSAEQIAAIQSTLKLALQAAQGSDAIEAAISNAETSAVSLYGAANTSAITSVLIQTSEKASVDQCTIGKGLGDAAAKLAPQNLSAANSVATSIANEANAMERGCFQTAVNAKGYSNLASIADGSPTVTGGTGGVGQGGLGGTFTGGGTAGGAGGGCLNPSCTSL